LAAEAAGDFFAGGLGVSLSMAGGDKGEGVGDEECEDNFLSSSFFVSFGFAPFSSGFTGEGEAGSGDPAWVGPREGEEARRASTSF
jgi:hypothetical protein